MHPLATDAWCSLTTRCSTTRKAVTVNHKRYIVLQVAKKSNNDDAAAEIDMETLKRELTEYMEKRIALSADELAKQ